MRRFHKKKLRFRSPEITLTPLIDTALTLLIIFLVTAPMVQNGIKIELPQGKTQEIVAEQEYVIAMAKDGSYYFNSFPIKKYEIVPLLKKSMPADLETPVYIKADEGLTYGVVVEIVDQLKHAGIKNVALTTRKSA